MSIRWIVIGLLCTSLEAIAQRVPNPVLQALPDGAWSLLPDSQMSAAGDSSIPCCDGHGCQLSGILSYSGATFDPARGRIIVWGGGHNDYFGNQLMLFNMSTLAWSMETQPSSMCDYPQQPSYVLLDGRPVSHHSYDHIQYIATRDIFFSFAGSAADALPFNGGSAYGDLWTYHFTSRTWVDHTAQLSGNNDYYLNASLGDSGEYDAITDSWYHLTSNGIWRYQFQTKVWTRMLEQGPPGIERTSVMDDRRRIWTYGGGYGGGATWSYYDIQDNTWAVVSNDSPPGARNSAGLAFDKANRQIVLYGGGVDNAVWNYDLEDTQWTSYLAPGAPVVQRVFQRFGYDAVNNLFYLVPNVDQVWIWKNALGSTLDRYFFDGFED